MKKLFYSFRKKKNYIETLVIILLIFIGAVVFSFSDFMQANLKYSVDYSEKSKIKNSAISLNRGSELKNEEDIFNFFEGQFRGDITSQYAYKIALTNNDTLKLMPLDENTEPFFFYEKFYDFSNFEYYTERSPKNDFKEYTFIKELPCEANCRSLELVEIVTYKQSVQYASRTVQQHHFNIEEFYDEQTSQNYYRTTYLGFHKESKATGLKKVSEKLGS